MIRGAIQQRREWRWVALAGLTAGSTLLANLPETVITLPQRDRFRSSRAPRSMDVSADGRTVAFESLAPLAPDDTDNNQDIYALDRTTGRVTLESGALGPGGAHSLPRISGDGRFVVFESRPQQSEATPRADIVLQDRRSGTARILTTTPANRDPSGWSRSPEISDDGRLIVFSSASTMLTSDGDRNGTREDVYSVKLGAEGMTEPLRIERVSLTSSGEQPEAGDSILPSISADGRWLTFASTAPLVAATNATAPDRERAIRQVFLRDLVAGRTIRISRTVNGGVPNADSSLPSISGDGRFVAFVSEASNVLDDDRNNGSDVFLYDRETDAVSWVSRAADGSSAAGESSAPAISADGRFVAFQSDAGNLVCTRRCSEHDGDINLLWDVFVFDRTSGKIVRVSEDELGGWMEASSGPSIDGQGRVVAFSSRHAVDAADRQDDFDLFVRVLAGTAAAVTRR